MVYRKKFLIIPRKSNTSSKWLIGWVYSATKIVNYDWKGYCTLENVYDSAEDATYQVMVGQAVIKDSDAEIDNKKYTQCFLLWPRRSNYGNYVWGKAYYSIDERALSIGVYVKNYYSWLYITNLAIHSAPPH